MNKQKLNSEQIEAANRLKSIWEKKKDGLGLTQEDVCALCGWSSQSTLSQYLNAKIPLNLKALLKLSGVLETDPKEIYPELMTEYSKVNYVDLSAEPLRPVYQAKETSPKLTPKSQAVLRCLAAAVDSGDLTEQDLLLLEQVAKRFKRKG